MEAATGKRIGVGLAGLLAVLVLVGGLAYAADYGVEAKITDKGQDAQGRYVIATTEIGGYDVKRYLPATQWSAVQEGYFVIYHIRSGETEVYTSEGGTLIYRG